MPIEIKQSATLVMALEFTEAEWDVLFPTGLEELSCQAKHKTDRVSITLTRYDALRTLVIQSETGTWPLGNVSIDVRVTRDGFSYYIPQLVNFELAIIESITEPS